MGFNMIILYDDDIYLLKGAIDCMRDMLYNKEVQNINNINNWKRENTRLYRLQLNNEKDKDIIEVLENESNKAAFIKDCIRKVIASTTK